MEKDTACIESFGSHRVFNSESALEIKIETVYALLSLFTCNNLKEEMCNKFYSMSQDKKVALEMRAHGCIPLLIQLIHPFQHFQNIKHPCFSFSDPQDEEKNLKVRLKACRTLHKIIFLNEKNKKNQVEMNVLLLLEGVRKFSEKLLQLKSETNLDVNVFHPCETLAQIMKISFDEECRSAICLLGGLQALSEAIYLDTKFHGIVCSSHCITFRRYILMTLTNLTFNDSFNKSSLCSNHSFIECMIHQFDSNSEELKQVTASVIRNLSWKADKSSKLILQKMSTVKKLIQTALVVKKDSTLKSILTALWNLSAHSTANKATICSFKGALQFLIFTLTYQSVNSSLVITESGSGIFRNVSSYIANNEKYLSILRQNNCFSILLNLLKSPSLTIVSNTCATLWNLSAYSLQDQKTLIKLGAVPMLSSLVNSKHKIISIISSATLKNLSSHLFTSLSFSLDANSFQDNNQALLLKTKKLNNFNLKLDESFYETCDNLDFSKTNPTCSASCQSGHFQNCHLFERLSSESSNTCMHHFYPNLKCCCAKSKFSLLLSSNNSFSDYYSQIEKQENQDLYQEFYQSQSQAPNSINKFPKNCFYLDSESLHNVLKETQKIEESETLEKEEPQNFSLIFTETSDDDLENEEKPIDFSLEYNENKFNQEALAKNNLNRENVSDFNFNIFNKNNKNFTSGNTSVIGNEDTIKVFREEDTPNMPGSPFFYHNNVYDNLSKKDLDVKINKLPSFSQFYVNNYEKCATKDFSHFDEVFIKPIDQTPLIYSRTSSVGSLSDCEVKLVENSTYNSESSSTKSELPLFSDISDSSLCQNLSDLRLETEAKKNSKNLNYKTYNHQLLKCHNFFNENFYTQPEIDNQLSKSLSQTNLSNLLEKKFPSLNDSFQRDVLNAFKEMNDVDDTKKIDYNQISNKCSCNKFNIQLEPEKLTNNHSNFDVNKSNKISLKSTENLNIIDGLEFKSTSQHLHNSDDLVKFSKKSQNVNNSVLVPINNFDSSLIIEKTSKLPKNCDSIYSSDITLHEKFVANVKDCDKKSIQKHTKDLIFCTDSLNDSLTIQKTKQDSCLNSYVHTKIKYENKLTNDLSPVQSKSHQEKKIIKPLIKQNNINLSKIFSKEILTTTKKSNVLLKSSCSSSFHSKSFAVKPTKTSVLRASLSKNNIYDKQTNLYTSDFSLNKKSLKNSPDQLKNTCVLQKHLPATNKKKSNF